MRYLKHFLRLLRYAIYAVLALAFGAILVFTLTERGRDNLAGLISDFISTPDQSVRLRGIDGIWTGELTLDSLAIGDRDGTWLVGRGVAVDWSPLALFSKTFRAERIFAERIEVARLPKGAEKQADDGAFSLPVSLSLKQIDLPDIAIGPELAGGVAAVAAKGSLRADASPLEIEAELNVARSDGGAGSIDASVHFVPAENRIDIDVDGSEPQGGIIANLLKLPDAPPVEIHISGEGPLANWQGSGTFAVDGTVVTRVEGRHQLTDRGSAIEAKGDGEFQRFVPEKLRPLLSGKTVFDIAGTATKAGGVIVERATVESNALRGTASGSIDPEGASDFALEAAATGDGVLLSFGTEESPIDMVVKSATLRALGAGSEPNLDISAVMGRVSTNSAAIDNLSVTLHSDAFNIAARTGPVTGQATADALTIDNPTIAPLVAGKISAGFAGTLKTDALTVSEGSLSSDALNGAFDGEVSLANGAIRLDIEADVASAALPAAVRPALAERVELSARFLRDTEGHVSADPFSLSSGALEAKGTIRSADEKIDATINGTLSDIGLVAKQASGAVEIALKAEGALRKPDVSVTLTSDSIMAAGREIAGLRLEASGRADIDNPAAAVSLSGTVGGEKLTGKASLSTAGERREVKDLSLSLGDNRIAGDLVLDKNFMPLGTVDFQLPDIGSLAALAAQTAEGDLNGTLTFSEEGGTPQLAVEAQTQKLSRGDITASDVDISAVVADYIAQPAVTGTVRAGTVTSGTTVVKDVDVKLSQDGGWTGFDGGATVSDIPARAAGRVRLADGRTTIELDSGRATVRGVEAKLARPTTVEIADGTTTLDRLALDLGGGSATISGTAGSTLDLNATVSGVPASIANSFAPGLSAAGTVSGTAKVTGKPADPSVGFSIDWKGAQTAQTREAGFGAMSLTTSGDFAGGRVTFDATIGEGSGLTLRGGGSVDTRARSLALDFAGGVPFAFLSERLAAQGLSLTGAADVNLSVSGGLGAPVISGTVTTSGARMVAARMGIAINDISADVALANGVATVRSLNGTLSTGGSISASGTVGIDPAQGLPANLAVQIRDGRYTDGRVVTATMTGDLTVTGQLSASPTLAGTIELGRTVITVPEKLPGSLAALDVRHKNATAAVQAQDRALSPAEPATGNSSDLMLDVNVNANNQIFVQGRGLDAELGGRLKLTGSASAPQAVGRFTMTRGRLSILGKRLVFSRGTITFSGSLVPYLDLAADSTSGDTTVTVTVSGPANDPRFSFTSNPALPEEEVLAQLIFGSSMSNLSPLQIVQLADAAAQLAGGGGTSTLLESLRSTIGVDDLDVRTTDDGSTAVTAGKYLNDRTYLSIEKGDKAGSGKATIDLRVGRGVKLRGQATDGGEAKAGIFYEREY